MTAVKTYRFHDDVIRWLCLNVGPLLWKRPIVEWKGNGWYVKSGKYDPHHGRVHYLVDIDDPHLETLFRIWS